MAALVTPGKAVAGCVGTFAYQTCTDDYGNAYTINRNGGLTQMQGFNSRTGSTWNQDSYSFGDMTMHSGRAADGGAWSMTEQSIGGSTIYSGTDSNGNPFTMVCNDIGCF